MPAPIKRNTLGKAEKLKSRKQIEQLFAEGRGFTAYPVKVVYRMVDSRQLTVDRHLDDTSGKLNSSIAGKSQDQTVPSVSEPLAAHHSSADEHLSLASPIQIGVSASTRHFKHAADRNRIKRLLREAYRQQKHELLHLATQKGLQLTVFFIYLDKTLPSYDLIFDKMRYCLKRLRKTLEEPAS